MDRDAAAILQRIVPVHVPVDGDAARLQGMDDVARSAQHRFLGTAPAGVENGNAKDRAATRFDRKHHPTQSATLRVFFMRGCPAMSIAGGRNAAATLQ